MISLEEFKPRDFSTIARQIQDVIERDCTFSSCRRRELINEIDRCIKDNFYRAPELAYESWNDLADVLNSYLVPSNSRWETEIMCIFGDLGPVDDYWDGD